MDVHIYIDFDYSLFEDNDSDNIIFCELATDIHDNLQYFYDDWEGDTISLKNHLFKTVRERGIMKQHIQEAYRRHFLSKHAIVFLKTMKNKASTINIISDSNTVFISEILKASTTFDCIAKIIANPAHFDENHQLNVGHFHSHDCESCPINLCKGNIMTTHLQTLGNSKIVYIGDGSNDYCPTLKLRSCDLVLARKGYSLDRRIRKKNHKMKATVVNWENWEEVLSILNNLEEFNSHKL